MVPINELNSSEDYFVQELFYDYGFDQKQYNGNLAGVQWKNADGKQQTTQICNACGATRLFQDRTNSDK